MNLNKKLLIAAVATATSIATYQAVATTTSMTSNIEFVQAIVLNNKVNLNFGSIFDDLGTQTIVIGTDGIVGGTGLTSHITGEVVGSVDIAGATQQIDIELTNITSTFSGVFLLSDPKCEYNSVGTDSDCGVGDLYNITPGVTTALKLEIGMTLTGVTPAPGSYVETFDVVAVYN